MDRIVEHQYSIKNNVLNGEISKSFIDVKDFETLKNNYFYGYVLPGMEYRPDLIADYYLGSSQSAWILYVVNEFTNGIKDFTKGRQIKIPNINLM